jgi:hypothetical protein
MKHILLTVLLAFMVLAVISCASRTQQGVTLKESGYEAIYSPPWYLPDSCQTTEEYLCQRATMESKDQQFAVNKASLEARAGLQLQMEARLELLSKGFAEEIGLAQDADFSAMYTQTTKQVASGVLALSVPYREETRKDPAKGIYRSWVLYRLLLNDAFLAHLKAVRSNNNLYTQFRQSEAFKEHEKEMEKFEQYKKDHGL